MFLPARSSIIPGHRMARIDLDRHGAVFVLRFNSGENRFDPGFLEGLDAALDRVEESEGPAAMVTTGAEPKFYSTGLDLDWLMGPGRNESQVFLQRVLRCLARVLAFPVPTVAAINGHAYAAGGMLALAHDFRVMRVDRGFFCLPEVDLRLPLAPGLLALIRGRLSLTTFRDAILTGARIGGAEAARRGIVDEAVPAPEVLDRAVAMAAGLAGKDRGIYGTLKRAMYAETIAILERGDLS